METPVVLIGVDVGGTNTDAVVVDRAKRKARVLSTAKTLTTADITSGVKEAIRLALLKLEDRLTSVAVQQVNIGTTHFINAVVEGKRLAKVSVIRLCGTASKRLPPFSDFPSNIVDTIKGSIFLVNGGYQFDGQDITKLDKTELLSVIETLKSRGERHIVVSGIYSPVRADQEDEVVELIETHYPEASITASKSIGGLGLLQRENAAILNECIKSLCAEVKTGFREALGELGLDCPLFLTQNDGTIMHEDLMMKFPVNTFASGATNSMRGAAFLSGVDDALVVDIGGTSTDVGVLMKAFPRRASSEVKICGIRTNFRMPDVISIGLGGGSYVTHKEKKVKIGPASSGNNITDEALVFAVKGMKIDDRSITALDIAAAAGIAQIGNIENVNSIPKATVEDGIVALQQIVTDCLDRMRFYGQDLPLILVGGGSILIDKKHKFSGVSSIIRPEHFEVANAVGAALSQVTATVDDTLNLEEFVNKTELDEKIKNAISNIGHSSEATEDSVTEKIKYEAMSNATDMAIHECIKLSETKVVGLGGKLESVKLLDKKVVPISHIPGHTRIIVKVVAELEATGAETCKVLLASLKDKQSKKVEAKEKQTTTTTGKLLDEDANIDIRIQSPCIDEPTGEWLISEYDIECISIGAGILGSGGGGSPHLGKIEALIALRAGNRPRVITPSKFFKTADKENDLTIVVAVMGAPTVLHEKLLSGTEGKEAVYAMQDLYNIGHYENGQLNNKEGVEIKEEEGLAYVDDYKPTAEYKSRTVGGKKIAAVMSAEIGGINSIEPLLVGAELDLPVLDCDGMGRAFPELQMFAPFIYDCPCYPSALADDKGRRSVALYASNPKRLEDCFRQSTVGMGYVACVVPSHFTHDQIMKYTVKHSTSYAWRIGNAVMEARRDNRSPVDETIKLTNGKLLINGKLIGARREVTCGFSRGTVKVVGIEDYTGQGITIDIQNEFLVARKDEDSGPGEVVACAPDLITVLDIDTAQPIPADELQCGMHVSVVAMPAAPLMTTCKALKHVGPQALGYPDEVEYKPIATYPDYKPVGPL